MKHRSFQPPATLQGRGPLVQVIFGLHDLDLTNWAGPEAPPTVAGLLLVDTGAQSTLVDMRIAQHLGLTPIKFQKVVGVNQKPELRPVFRMMLGIGMQDTAGRSQQAQFHADMIGMETMKNDPQCVGLLGRDFLRHVRLVYDGPSGIVEIIDGRHAEPIMRASRNDPCPCGSGRKFKKCHGA